MSIVRNQKSKIKQLPAHIREPMNTLIRTGEMTQKELLDEVHRLCEEAGLPDEAKPSRSGLNRYVKHMEDMGARIREAREVAEVWAAKLGDAPATDLSKLLQESVRTMVFETSMFMSKKAELEQKEVSPKVLNQLALVIQRIEQAAMTSQKVEKEIRAAFAAEAAAKTEVVAKKAGLTADTVKMLKAELLGIA